MTSEGKKYDSGKSRPGLIPPRALLAVGKVLAYGAQKYDDNNWHKVEPKERYVDACFRHLAAYMSGEKVDEESGLSHLAHAACCVLFLLGHESGDVPAASEPPVETPDPLAPPAPFKVGDPVSAIDRHAPWARCRVLNYPDARFKEAANGRVRVLNSYGQPGLFSPKELVRLEAIK